MQIALTPVRPNMVSLLGKVRWKKVKRLGLLGTYNLTSSRYYGGEDAARGSAV